MRDESGRLSERVSERIIARRSQLASEPPQNSLTTASYPPHARLMPASCPPHARLMPASGKSSVLANWFLVNNLEGFVLPHFVGSSSDSTSHVRVVERILMELQRAFDIPGEIPKAGREMFGLLPLWLERVCERAPVIIIIDGIDKLQGTEAWSLGWLPAKVPAACSLLPGIRPLRPRLRPRPRPRPCLRRPLCARQYLRY